MTQITLCGNIQITLCGELPAGMGSFGVHECWRVHNKVFPRVDPSVDWHVDPSMIRVHLQTE